MSTPDLAALEAAILARQGRWRGAELHFLCPDHEDRVPSARWNAAKQTWYCDPCGKGGGWKDLAERLDVQLGKGGGGRSTPAGKPANAQTRGGLTLARYAEAKGLPIGRLRQWGLSDASYLGAPSVRIGYPDPDGNEAAVRFRLELAKGEDGDDRFRWRKGSKPLLYGLNRLHRAVERGYAVLAEGESDTQTLWLHDEPGFGIPGAGIWKEERDAGHFDGIPIIYLVREPDKGGETVDGWLAKSAIRERVRIVELGEYKDASGLYLADPAHFLERWQASLAAAVPWTKRASAERNAERQAAWLRCEALAREPRILDRFAEALAASGLVGEERAARLLYLIVTSRLLARPTSAAVKGPSSGGKSYLVERVLSFVPEAAYYALSAMSERALAYSEEPLKHRVLVIYEAAGLQGDFASYLVRSLLSEGRVRYETVEKTKDGLRPRLIEREGPTGLLVTTTAARLHPENETRLLSLVVTDTPEQTRRVFLALAEGEQAEMDREPWLALQRWLETGEHRVIVPFALALAERIPPLAVRLRRDFAAVLNLIRAHALLHQATRERDTDGRIVATLDDYAVVRELVAELVGEGVGATVSGTVRETVTAVAALTANGSPDCVSVSAVARELKLDTSAAYRRVQVAIAAGYLKNLEDKRGRPARLVVGEPLPEEQELLPSAEGLQVCSAAPGDRPTPPPIGACLACGRPSPRGLTPCEGCIAEEAA